MRERLLLSGFPSLHTLESIGSGLEQGVNLQYLGAWVFPRTDVCRGREGKVLGEWCLTDLAQVRHSW